MIAGRCECGEVHYQVDGDLVDFCHCHCSICRRIHGAAFASWGGVLRSEFSYVCGQQSVERYAFSDRSDSLFCGVCSSTLLVDYKPDADMLYITLGTVIGDIFLPPGFHQFVGSKASWYEISDDLPQFDTSPESSLLKLV